MVVGFTTTYASSIWGQFKPYLRRSDEELPEVALIGSDVSHMTGSGPDPKRP